MMEIMSLVMCLNTMMSDISISTKSGKTTITINTSKCDKEIKTFNGMIEAQKAKLKDQGDSK